MNENEIRAFIPIACPHCDKPVLVEFVTTAPKVVDLHTPASIELTKQEAISRLQAIPGHEAFSKPIIDWINNPETVFGMNDIDEIIANANPQATHEPEEA